jgi:hypothetical protein
MTMLIGVQTQSIDNIILTYQHKIEHVMKEGAFVYVKCHISHLLQ